MFHQKQTTTKKQLSGIYKYYCTFKFIEPLYIYQSHLILQKVLGGHYIFQTLQAEEPTATRWDSWDLVPTLLSCFGEQLCDYLCLYLM